MSERASELVNRTRSRRQESSVVTARARKYKPRRASERARARARGRAGRRTRGVRLGMPLRARHVVALVAVQQHEHVRRPERRLHDVDPAVPDYLGERRGEGLGEGLRAWLRAPDLRGCDAADSRGCDVIE